MSYECDSSTKKKHVCQKQKHSHKKKYHKHDCHKPTFDFIVVGAGNAGCTIANRLSENGKYRILVAPDKDDVKWPEALRVGSGANGIALLKDVPIWYELWRNLNGFPPDYYDSNEENSVSQTTQE